MQADTEECIGIAIDTFLSADRQSGSCQADMLCAFIGHSAYTKERVVRFFRAEPSDRVRATDRELSGFSEQYGLMYTRVSEEKEKPNGARADHFELEAKQLQAARLMYRRTLTGLLFLRHVKAESVSVNDAQKLSYTALSSDGIRYRMESSARALTRAGNELLEQLHKGALEERLSKETMEESLATRALGLGPSLDYVIEFVSHASEVDDETKEQIQELEQAIKAFYARQASGQAA